MYISNRNACILTDFQQRRLYSSFVWFFLCMSVHNLWTDNSFFVRKSLFLSYSHYKYHQGIVCLSACLFVCFGGRGSLQAVIFVKISKCCSNTHCYFMVFKIVFVSYIVFFSSRDAWKNSIYDCLQLFYIFITLL